MLHLNIFSSSHILCGIAVCIRLICRVIYRHLTFFLVCHLIVYRVCKRKVITAHRDKVFYIVESCTLLLLMQVLVTDDIINNILNLLICRPVYLLFDRRPFVGSKAISSQLISSISLMFIAIVLSRLIASTRIFRHIHKANRQCHTAPNVGLRLFIIKVAQFVITNKKGV